MADEQKIKTAGALVPISSHDVHKMPAFRQLAEQLSVDLSRKIRKIGIAVELAKPVLVTVEYIPTREKQAPGGHQGGIPPKS